MSLKSHTTVLLQGARFALASLAMLQFSVLGPPVDRAQAHEKEKTRTPIKHVIVIVGENRSFDHLFATYQAKDGQSVNNLLSKRIIKEDGTPGKEFHKAWQYSADVTGSTTYNLSPTTKKAVYPVLPAPLNGGPTDVCKNNGICTLADATSSENGLPDTTYYGFLMTGGTSLTGSLPDSRINGVNNTAPYSTLPPGPFQLTDTKGSNPFVDNSYAASPLHRFYQMWQQEDCNAKHATRANPSGCLADLFTWTEVTVGSNNNGKPQPPNFSTD